MTTSTVNGGGNGINYAQVGATKYQQSDANSATDIIKDLLPAFVDETSGGAKWGGNIGSGVTLTYSFSVQGISQYEQRYDETGLLQTISNNVQTLNSLQKSAALYAMAAWSNVANIQFVSISNGLANSLEASDTTNKSGDIRWSATASIPAELIVSGSIPPAAFGIQPGASWTGTLSSPHHSNAAGDLWLNNASSSALNPITDGTAYGSILFMHELGHALGLAHPFDTGIIDLSAMNWRKYTVMAYNNVSDGSPSFQTAFNATTPMLNDIAAIQYLYGANFGYKTGNDLYQWGSTQKIFETIYDAGGNDTINAANQTQAVSINLNPGTFSNIGQAFNDGDGMVRDRLAMSYETKDSLGNVVNYIENAIGSGYNDTLIGNAAHNILQGNNGDDLLQGGAGNDTLNGGAGNDTLDGGIGNDSMVGGLGNDYYVVDSAADMIIESASAGSDWVLSGINHTLGTNLENLQLTGSDNLAGAGNALNNILLGNSGHNQLSGGAGDDSIFAQDGNDTLVGGAGNDTLDGGTGTDWVNYGTETVALNINLQTSIATGAGTDKLINIENINSGSGNDTLIGNAADNQINAGTGNDTLNGGLGNDTLNGGAGTDWADYGADTVNLNINLQTSVGTGAGSDVLLNIEHIKAGSGNDLIVGNASANQLLGGLGNDTLDGGTGSDTMIGGAGNDYYIIDSTGDVVTEDANAGSDWILSSINHTLSAYVENIQLTGTANLNATGSDKDNAMLGNSGNNQINGGAGNDTLYAQDGNDTLNGGTGNDVLNGGAGNDSMNGDVGSDTYLLNGGFGQDTINDRDSSSTNNSDAIVFDSSVNPASVLVSRIGTDLVLTVGADKVTISGYFSSATALTAGTGLIENIRFNDAAQTSWNLSAVVGKLSNHAPTVQTPLTAQTAAEDQAFSFTVAATTFKDVDAGDTLTYSATRADGSTLPSWLTFNAVTRTFNGTPTNADVGNISVLVKATDTAGASATTLLTLIITNVNDAPVVQTALTSQTTASHQIFNYEVPVSTFKDIDVGDALSYSATRADGSALPSWLTFNATTHTFSGKPMNSDLGNLLLLVTATDVAGASVSTPLTLNVVEGPNNGPMVVTSFPTLSINENQSFTYVIPSNTFIDADGDTLIYSAKQANLAGLPTWLSFNPTTRTFSGTPTDTDVGTLVLYVSASDGSAKTTTQFIININNVNNAPTVQTPLTAQTTAEDQAFSFTVPTTTFSDIDVGDTLTYSATRTDGSVLPNWLSFNAATRTFTGTPTNGDVGNISVLVKATDTSGASVTTPLSLTITNVNDAPTVQTALTTQSATEGQAFSFTVPTTTFSDIDVGDTLTYSATRADGSALPNWLRFNAATRTFSGTPTNGDAGNLSIQVKAVDTAGASVGTVLQLTINAGGGSFTGTLNADTLQGTAYADTLIGLAGDDTYMVNRTNDVIVEQSNAGTDIVLSSVNYTLSANVEHLTLTGNAAINGTGNELNNYLTGNTSANQLFGGAGNDTLNGGSGADSLFGGLGNDIYIIDDTVDVVSEDANSGSDWVYASVNYTLGSYVENLQLTGTANINGTGNSKENAMLGNSANNELHGDLGADTIYGLDGNDMIYGEDGNDVLRGNGGLDTLIGGAGNDVFEIKPGAIVSSGNADIIVDFSIGQDILRIDSGNFAKFSGMAGQTLSSANFVVGTKALDANDYIVYNQTTGQLFYDPDGSATAYNPILIADLTDGLALTNTMIQIM